MPIERGRVNLSLCHHPPDWCRDRDVVSEALLAGTHVQLYGHKHRSHLMLSNGSLIVGAGATHPDRGDAWDPRYNVIELSVGAEDCAHVLLATVYPRVFKRATRRFHPDYQDEGKEFETFQILLPSPRNTGPTHPAVPLDQPEDDAVDTVAGAESNVDLNPREGNLMHPLRRLGYLLVELPDHRLVQLARDLDLLDESGTRPNTARLIQLARERGRLEQLWDLAAGFAHETSPNPFRRDEAT